MKTSVAYVLTCLLSCSGGVDSGAGQVQCELSKLGGKAFQNKLQAAIDRLPPQEWQYVKATTCIIEQHTETQAKFPATIQVGPPELNESDTWLASTLVHNACHLAHPSLPSVEIENHCNRRQQASLVRMNAPDSEIRYIATQDGTHVCRRYPNAEGCS